MPQPSTHQANRAPGDLKLNLRNSFESETWDDNASVIYAATPDLTVDTVAIGGTLVVCSISVGTPVQARFQVEAQVHAHANGGAVIWNSFVRLATIDTIWSEVMRWPSGFSSNVVWTGPIDVAPGQYTLDIKLVVDALSPTGVDFYNKRLLIRRGRKPSTV